MEKQITEKRDLHDWNKLRSITTPVLSEPPVDHQVAVTAEQIFI